MTQACLWRGHCFRARDEGGKVLRRQDPTYRALCGEGFCQKWVYDGQLQHCDEIIDLEFT